MFIKPKHLQENDSVCTVSLSRGWPGACPERYIAGKEQLEKGFNLKVIEWAYTLQSPGWVYDHPEARAQDLMAAFKDPNIKAIISTIGGEESIRILPYIDFELIKNNPKIFMGYSDTTVSHFICQKAWIVSFYGPSIMAWFAENTWIFPYMRDAVHKTLFTSEVLWEILPNTSWWTSEFLDRNTPANQLIKRRMRPCEWRRWLQGKGIHSWKLIGWCIDVFPFLQGTTIWPSREQWKDKFLIIETSEEKMDTRTFERIIRNLGSQWILTQITWILLWRSQYDYEKNIQISYDEVLLKIVNKELWLTDLPIVTNMDFGHTDPLCVLPLWCDASLDCDKQKFVITENACI